MNKLSKLIGMTVLATSMAFTAANSADLTDQSVYDAFGITAHQEQGLKNWAAGINIDVTFTGTSFDDLNNDDVWAVYTTEYGTTSHIRLLDAEPETFDHEYEITQDDITTTSSATSSHLTDLGNGQWELDTSWVGTYELPSDTSILAGTQRRVKHLLETVIDAESVIHTYSSDGTVILTVVKEEKSDTTVTDNTDGTTTVVNDGTVSDTTKSTVVEDTDGTYDVTDSEGETTMYDMDGNEETPTPDPEPTPEPEEETTDPVEETADDSTFTYFDLEPHEKATIDAYLPFIEITDEGNIILKDYAPTGLAAIIEGYGLTIVESETDEAETSEETTEEDSTPPLPEGSSSYQMDDTVDSIGYDLVVDEDGNVTGTVNGSGNIPPGARLNEDGTIVGPDGEAIVYVKDDKEYTITIDTSTDEVTIDETVTPEESTEEDDTPPADAMEDDTPPAEEAPAITLDQAKDYLQNYIDDNEVTKEQAETVTADKLYEIVTADGVVISREEFDILYDQLSTDDFDYYEAPTIDIVEDETPTETTIPSYIAKEKSGVDKAVSKVVDKVTDTIKKVNSPSDIQDVVDKYGDIYIAFPSIELDNGGSIQVRTKRERGEQTTDVTWVSPPIDFNCILFKKCIK